MFLSIKGNAVVIKKNQILIDVVPLRRISEIVITVNNILSAALIRQCIEHEVLLTIRLNSGYTIPVIEP
jgi:CRISPR/Cas system-associated endonuclease Cas1